MYRRTSCCAVHPGFASLWSSSIESTYSPYLYYTMLCCYHEYLPSAVMYHRNIFLYISPLHHHIIWSHRTIYISPSDLTIAAGRSFSSMSSLHDALLHCPSNSCCISTWSFCPSIIIIIINTSMLHHHMEEVFPGTVQSAVPLNPGRHYEVR
jgi:hypothetical protein